MHAQIYISLISALSLALFPQTSLAKPIPDTYAEGSAVHLARDATLVARNCTPICTGPHKVLCPLVCVEDMRESLELE